MVTKHSLKKRRRSSQSDESGMTLVEMVIAIPITFLILGLVLATVGVIVGLMGQVTESAGAARAGTSAIEELATARSCAELNMIATNQEATDAEDRFQLSYDYLCMPDKSSFPVNIEVRDIESDKLYYSKTITLAAV